MAEDAEDRTEEASARRLQRAREDGDVPLAREAGLLAGLAGGVACLAVQISFDPAGPLRWFGGAVQRGATGVGVTALGVERVILGAVLPPAVCAVAAAVAATVLQTGILIRPQALQPDFSRVSPGRGLARIFSAETLVGGLKSVAKLVLLAVVLRAALHRLLPRLAAVAHFPAAAMLPLLGHEVLRVVVLLCGAQAALAAADYFFVHRRYAARLRMTRQEQRDEAKESDGNPQVKQKLRQVRYMRAKRRMMAAIRSAAVVVTNPEHYAVALAYERGSRAAPRVVAKGVDEVAARIREEARNHGVPIVANPPLARALFRLELETEIPREHFKAVAEIVAYIWRLQARRPVL